MLLQCITLIFHDTLAIQSQLQLNDDGILLAADECYNNNNVMLLY